MNSRRHSADGSLLDKADRHTARLVCLRPHGIYAPSPNLSFPGQLSQSRHTTPNPSMARETLSSTNMTGMSKKKTLNVQLLCVTDGRLYPMLSQPGSTKLDASGP